MNLALTHRGLLGRGWAFPVRLEHGSIAASVEEASVQEAIGLILSTRKGERVMRPGFGCNLDPFVFAPNNAATQAAVAFEARDALETWEPRIEIVDVTAHAGGERGEVLLVEIDYRVRSSDNRFSLVYPFYLDRAAV